MGAVIRVGAAGGAGRRCGTSEPLNTSPDDGRGAAGAVTAGRGAGLGACAWGVATGGIRPVPRGSGPARNVVWGGRPHCTGRRAKGVDLSSASDIRSPAPGGAHHEEGRQTLKLLREFGGFVTADPDLSSSDDSPS